MAVESDCQPPQNIIFSIPSPCSNKSNAALDLSVNYIERQLLELDYIFEINIA